MIEALATIALATAVGGSVALLILWIPDSVLAWLIPLSIEQVPDNDELTQWRGGDPNGKHWTWQPPRA